jgi:ORF6N domain-containing protein
MVGMRESITVPVKEIARTILILRGQRVILDTRLAGFYGVTTRRLNERVKRNIDRFPDDFMFRLTQTESTTLNRSQNVTSNSARGGRRYPRPTLTIMRTSS